jgi:LAO/AO transport system kinase
MDNNKDITQLFASLQAGDRRSLARAITFCESSKLEDQRVASKLLSQAPRNMGTRRIGVCGAPGVGKSTFINALGQTLMSKGYRLAVLAIDPSSPRSGGSILGDKTRMPDLLNTDAFIRPTPSKGVLGGIARHTHEAIALVEAAGYNLTIVETVGLGQSEVDIADHVDCVIGLHLPNAGDDLQAIKRGIMEFVDMVVVNKADGNQLALADQSVAMLKDGLSYISSRHQHQIPTMALSSIEKSGLEPLMISIDDFFNKSLGEEQLKALRVQQAQRWFDAEVQHLFGQELLRVSAIQASHNSMRQKVLTDKTSNPKKLALELFDNIVTQLT